MLQGGKTFDNEHRLIRGIHFLWLQPFYGVRLMYDILQINTVSIFEIYTYAVCPLFLYFLSIQLYKDTRQRALSSM